MGLDAFVYCDCVEKGRLAISHPLPDLLFIDETGYPNISSDKSRDIALHDAWEAKHPCPHERFRLLKHRLGNVWLVELIREALRQISANPLSDFPTLWSKVIYSETHTGDFLRNQDVLRLSEELVQLNRALSKKEQYSSLKEKMSFLKEFVAKLEELIQASLAVRKPIAF